MVNMGPHERKKFRSVHGTNPVTKLVDPTTSMHKIHRQELTFERFVVSEMIFDEESFIYSPTVWEEMEVNFRSMKHACLGIAFPANDPRFGGRGNIEAVIPTALIIYKHKYNSVL